MSEKHEIKIGDTATVKVGCNSVQVKILKPMAGGRAFMVKSLSSGREFIAQAGRLDVPTAPVPLETEDAPPPAPENVPTKKMSLMDAAIAVLRESGELMNTREIVKAATEKGYWTPTACKTPEQTLYGSIFREIKTKAQPRIVKSDIKGKFKLR